MFGDVVDLPFDFLEIFNIAEVECPYESLGCIAKLLLKDF